MTFFYKFFWWSYFKEKLRSTIARLQKAACVHADIVCMATMIEKGRGAGGGKAQTSSDKYSSSTCRASSVPGTIVSGQKKGGGRGRGRVL